MSKVKKEANSVNFQNFACITRKTWPFSLSERRKCLKRLLEMLSLHEKEICDALFKDLHKPTHESLMCEVLTSKQELQFHIKNLRSMVDSKAVHKSLATFGDNNCVEFQPLGLVLILGAWNYPIQLIALPLAGALAAGNCVVLKPSELAPATAALLSRLIPVYLESVFNGGPNETANLLASNKFDFIFYTGSSRVGKLIMAEAAKNLTPVCLELGGKSPVYIDASADIPLTARRIMWGKTLNAGQTCVAPDYVLCHEAVQEHFIEECKSVLMSFFPEGTEHNDDYGRLINKNHTQRLISMLESSKGTVRVGGSHNVSAKYIEPTLVEVQPDDSLMKEEIFGPILPIITVGSSQEAIDFVNKGEKPLSIYVFSSSKSVFAEWREKTSSGGILHNDCIMLAGTLGVPFGGVGNSGMGRYHGKSSFLLFSNARSVMDKNTSENVNNKLRYAPYDDKKEKWLRFGMQDPDRSSCNLM
uniref:Aldehyde dehydrogenase n=2 Tax=Schistocephalus solidus TaxID=70667 RepID=A0A0X3P5W3_SCHSO